METAPVAAGRPRPSVSATRRTSEVRVRVPWGTVFLGRWVLLAIPVLASTTGGRSAQVALAALGVSLLNGAAQIACQRYDRMPSSIVFGDVATVLIWAWIFPGAAAAATIAAVALLSIDAALSSRCQVCAAGGLYAAGVGGGIATHALPATVAGSSVVATAVGASAVHLGVNLLRTHQQARVQHRVLHDELSGLPNRQLLLDRLDSALADADDEEAPLALLVLDLDRFRDVNDAFGHRIGDRLLAGVARRLAEPLQPGDTVGRSGGDQFAVILPGTDAAGAEAMALRLHEALNSPFHIEGVSIRTSATIGIALYPTHSSEPADLERLADVGIRAARRNGHRTAPYRPTAGRTTRRDLALVGQLGDVANDRRRQIEVWYQPKLSLAERAITGAEALVRWRHPEHGLLEPDDFIGLAETSGAIRALTETVISQAVTDAHLLAEHGVEIAIACNLSTRSLGDHHLVGLVDDLAGGVGLPPGGLELELTETGIMDDPIVAREVFDALRERGIRGAIDDFGTGYSSLAHLRHLRLEALKIDRSLVTGLCDDPDGWILVQTTIEMAHNLGMEVVAEGVEDMETLEALSDLGCDHAQGYLIGRAMPLSDLAGVFGVSLDAGTAAPEVIGLRGRRST